MFGPCMSFPLPPWVAPRGQPPEHLCSYAEREQGYQETGDVDYPYNQACHY